MPRQAAGAHDQDREAQAPPPRSAPKVDRFVPEARFVNIGIVRQKSTAVRPGPLTRQSRQICFGRSACKFRDSPLPRRSHAPAPESPSLYAPFCRVDITIRTFLTSFYAPFCSSHLIASPCLSHRHHSTPIYDIISRTFLSVSPHRTPFSIRSTTQCVPFWHLFTHLSARLTSLYAPSCRAGEARDGQERAGARRIRRGRFTI